MEDFRPDLTFETPKEDIMQVKDWKGIRWESSVGS